MIFRELFHQEERGLKYFLKIKNYRKTPYSSPLWAPSSRGKSKLSDDDDDDDDDYDDDDDDDEKGR